MGSDTDRAIRRIVGGITGSAVTRIESVPGGDLNDAFRVTLADGRRVFVKTSADAARGGYTAESAGLAWMRRAPGAPECPVVVAVADPLQPSSVGTRMLVLEWIDTGPLTTSGEEAFGRGLAALHRAGARHHGSLPPSDAVAPPQELVVGPLRFPVLTAAAGPSPGWPQVYAEMLVRPAARMAETRGGLDADGLRAVDRLCDRMAELTGPPESPARLHGDLWAGNVIAGADGTLYLVDPAAYGGHREMDLAMLRLFGGPGERCFAAYDEAYPLADGHEDRVALCQLFPLLVHAALFGGGYGVRAVAICRRYGEP